MSETSNKYKARYIIVICPSCKKEVEIRTDTIHKSAKCRRCAQTENGKRVGKLSRKYPKQVHRKDIIYNLARKKLIDYLHQHRITLSKFIKKVGNVSGENIRQVMQIGYNYSAAIARYLRNEIGVSIVKKTDKCETIIALTAGCGKHIKEKNGRSKKCLECARTMYSDYNECLTMTAMLDWQGWEAK